MENIEKCVLLRKDGRGELNMMKNTEQLLIRGISAEEAETVILIRKSEDFATIETTDNSMLTKLKKLLDCGVAEIEQQTQNANGLTSVTVKFPKRLITLRSKTREITEEQRDASRARLVAYRKQKGDCK